MRHRPATHNAICRTVAALYPEFPVQTCANAAQAVRQAFGQLSENELLCVTGSVFLAGIARSEIR
jgi:hypothetical protein